MKICLIGEYSYSPWVGSATQKIQVNLLKNWSSGDQEILFFEKLPTRNKIVAYLSKLSFKRSGHVIYVNGGMVRLMILILRKRVDVLHLMVVRRHYLLLYILKCVTKIKFVTTIHDTLFLRNTKKEILSWHNAIVKTLSLKWTDVALVFNEKDKKLIESKFHKECTVIRNGVNMSLYEPGRSARQNNVITFAGGLGKTHKGLEFLQNALSLVNQSYHFEICGENSAGVVDKHYVGELAETSFIKQLQKSRIVVVPSRYDSFSMVGLEAMACGVPLIITEGCGLSSYLENGNGCFVVPYGDVTLLTTCISTLLSNEQLRKKMGKEALTIARRFSWESVLIDYSKLYDSIFLHESISKKIVPVE